MSNEDDGLNHNRAQRSAENYGGTPRDLGLVTLHLTLSVNKYNTEKLPHSIERILCDIAIVRSEFKSRFGAQ